MFRQPREGRLLNRAIYAGRLRFYFLLFLSRGKRWWWCGVSIQLLPAPCPHVFPEHFLCASTGGAAVNKIGPLFALKASVVGEKI